MFSVSAKHDLKIRRHWPWPLRAIIVLFPLIVIGLLLWKNFSGTADVPPPAPEPAPEVSVYEEQISELRKRNAMLESELAMQQGLEAESREQTRSLTEENTQLKEELAYLQKLVADATAEAGVRIQDARIQAGAQKNEWRYRILLVQGGNPKEDFEGELRIAAYTAAAERRLAAPEIRITDKDGNPQDPYALKFKYYERIENTFRVPEGQTLDRVEIRIYKTGAQEPLATRSVSLN